MTLRDEVLQLQRLGPLPAEGSSQAQQDRLDEYRTLIEGISKPVSDEEARTLVKLFGPDDCYGLSWGLLHLVESCPGWPLADTLQNSNNEWVRFLTERARRAGRLQASDRL